MNVAHNSTGTAGLGESKREILSGQSWRELAIVHRINSTKLLACLNQIRNQIRRILDIYLGFRYVHDDISPLRAKLVMNVPKAAYALTSKKTTRRSWTRIRSRKQGHMKSFSIRPVDEWHILNRDERLSAVGASFRVSLHGEFRSILRPIESLFFVILPTVQKTLLPPVPQVPETTRAFLAGLGVQQSHDFRTGRFVEVYS